MPRAASLISMAGLIAFTGCDNGTFLMGWTGGYVLLSAALFDHTGQHTLDALAARFGIEIPDHLRHSALGDSMATAEGFLKMLDVMQADGIDTPGDAIEASHKMSGIRRAQDY